LAISVSTVWRAVDVRRWVQDRTCFCSLGSLEGTGNKVATKDDVIRASEIGQYVYCARAWWLGQVLGYRSTNVAAMREGAARHRFHGRQVEAYHRLRWLAIALLVLAGMALLIWLLSSFGG
jgi:hypothetical protein